MKRDDDDETGGWGSRASWMQGQTCCPECKKPQDGGWVCSECWEAEEKRERGRRVREGLLSLQRSLPPALLDFAADGRAHELLQGKKLPAVSDRFQPQHGNVLLAGPSGVGKTLAMVMCARRLMSDAIAAGNAEHAICFSFWSSGLRIARALREQRLGSPCEELEHARRCRVLFLDEVGQELADPRWLLELLNDRYECKFVTLTTSGFSKVELEARYGSGATRRFTEPEGTTIDLFQVGIVAGFVKLYQSILDSSVWSEDLATRIVWITLLAMAGPDGRVEASAGGLARRAQVTREQCDRALEVLSSPDPDDKSGVNEGRRIVKCERGWRLVNYAAYREHRTETQIKTAERVRKYREKNGVTCNDVTPSNALKRAEAEAEAEGDLDREGEREREKQTQLPLVAAPAPSASTKPAGNGSKAKGSASNPKRSWRRVPEDWEPKEAHRRIAAEEGRDFNREVLKFRDYEYPRAKTDADAAFRSWLR